MEASHAIETHKLLPNKYFFWVMKLLHAQTKFLVLGLVGVLIGIRTALITGFCTADNALRGPSVFLPNVGVFFGAHFVLHLIAGLWCASYV
jgi:hypothetical protein